MIIASCSDKPEKSAVALKPCSRALWMSVDGIRNIYDRPASRSVTFLASMSKPVTLKPASERRRDSGSPTYPSPITPILAVRVSMRSMRSCAIFGKTTSFVIDIVTIIASTPPQPKLHESRIDGIGDRGLHNCPPLIKPVANRKPTHQD